MPAIISHLFLEQAKDDAYFFYDLCTKTLDLAMPGKAKFLNNWATYIGYDNWQSFTAITSNAHKESTGKNTVNIEVLNRFSKDLVAIIANQFNDVDFSFPIPKDNAHSLIEFLFECLGCEDNLNLKVESLRKPEITERELIHVLSSLMLSKFDKFTDRRIFLSNRVSQAHSSPQVIVHPSEITSVKEKFNKYYKVVKDLSSLIGVGFKNDRRNIESAWVSLLGFDSWDDFSQACILRKDENISRGLTPEFIAEIVTYTNRILGDRGDYNEDYFAVDMYVELLFTVFDNNEIQSLVRRLINLGLHEIDINQYNFDETVRNGFLFIESRIGALIGTLAENNGFGCETSSKNIHVSHGDFLLEWKIDSRIYDTHGVDPEIFPYWTEDQLRDRSENGQHGIEIDGEYHDFGPLYEIQVIGKSKSDHNKELFTAEAYFISINVLLDSFGPYGLITSMDINSELSAVCEATFGIFPPLQPSLIFPKIKNGYDLHQHIVASINDRFDTNLSITDNIPSIMVITKVIKKSEDTNLDAILRSLVQANNSIFADEVLAYVNPFPLQYSADPIDQNDHSINSIPKHGLESDTKKLRALFAKNGFIEIGLSKHLGIVNTRMMMGEEKHHFMAKYISVNELAKSVSAQSSKSKKHKMSAKDFSSIDVLPFGLLLAPDDSKVMNYDSLPYVDHDRVEWNSLLSALETIFQAKQQRVKLRICDDTVDVVTAQMRQMGSWPGPCDFKDFGAKLQSTAKQSNDSVVKIRSEWADFHVLNDRSNSPPPVILPLILSGDITDIAQFVQNARMVLGIKAANPNFMNLMKEPDFEDEQGYLTNDLLSLFKKHFGIDYIAESVIVPLV